MELNIFVFTVLWLTSLLHWQVTCKRFTREELGVIDRLRFTSGKNQYYDCEIVNNRLVSNLKIGIYVYDHKSSIKYYINDTNYKVSTEKLEDFYFAHITVKNKVDLDSNLHIRLTAKGNNDLFIDETILNVAGLRQKITAAPTFLNSTSTIIVLRENVVVGTSVGKLHVENELVPVTFYLAEKDFNTIKEFTVSVDGRIILTKQLNSKRKKKYNFPIYVRYTESSKSSSINIKIIVKPSLKLTEHRPIGSIGTLRDLYKFPVNGKAAHAHPVSIHKKLTFSFSELSPIFTIIGSVSEPSIDFLYKIITGNDDQIFDINSKTGVISVAVSSKLDFESKKSYVLSISGTYLDESTLTVDLTLNVLDANDNSPKFSQSRYSINIKEDTSVGTTISKLAATDEDSGENGKVSYVLSNTEIVPFSVHLDGSLVVASSLSVIQNSDSYNVYVKAVDSGSPFRRETEVLVKVNIIKINSHKPVLRQSYCDVTIPSNSKKAMVTLALQAVDQDLDKLNYRIKNENAMFILNAESGELSLATDISGGQISSQELEVYVSDGKHDSEITKLNINFGGNAVSENCESNKEYFTIKGFVDSRINTIPTEKPMITPKLLVPIQFIKTPPKYHQISEGAPVYTVIGVFNALNSNLQSYGISLYAIISGNEDGKFQIDLFNGTLYLREQLDRESTLTYWLEIQASGMSGEEPAKYVLQVKVEDVNDNPPVFTNDGDYKISISEHKNIGYVLVKVQATDKDLELRQRGLRYSLVSPSSIFKMNPVTGELTLESPLSKQPFKEYFIQVQASDQSAVNQLHGYAWVHIIVSEFANNPPVCLSDEQKIEVATNTPAGVTIGRVFAYDVNDGEAGKLKYIIKRKNNLYFDDYFSLSNETGLIQLKKQLSQQDKGVVFKIQVEVRDNGSPPLSAICHVYKIIVDGSGLSQPNFEDQSTPIIASVSYNAGQGASATQLRALLPGNQTSQNIKYELVDGNGIGIFTIDNLLGTIYVEDSSFTSPFYWLTVQAYLATNPASYRNAHVLIQIQHKKTRKPYFDPSVYHVSLEYSGVDERSIVQLYATDGNRRYNVKGLKYEIFTGNKNGLFEIDNNGWIKSKKLLNMGQYRLNVTVASISNTSLISYGYVIVNVKNDNSIPPKFESDMAEVSVYETLENGFRPPYLFQALAMNPSSDEMLAYKLESSQGSHYIMNGETGVVDTKDQLKYGSSGLLVVQAINSQQKTANAMYVISVVPSPKKTTTLSFKRKTYYADIPENAVVGTTVVDFKDEIKQTGDNYHVHYYILSGNDQQNFYFSPLASSSRTSLKIWRPLDFERQSVHNLEILAFNGRAYAKTYVKVDVDNVNDNSLAASQACFESRISENERSYDNLIKVQVTDPDKKLPGFKYSLVNDAEDTSPFTVNNDGAVSVKPGKRFDRETKDQYVITVVGGLSQENATYCVKVFITDMNDHQPNFTRNAYQISVLDSAPVGTFILTAYATDKDTGPNARLSYSLIKESHYFGINLQNGIVFVKNDLSPLDNQTIVLDTIATDHGSPPKSGNTKIKISVVRDLQRLQFPQSTYIFNISENLPAKTLVSDSIKLNMSYVHYEKVAVEQNDCYKNFWVDPFTGIILTANVLDYEKYTNCHFKINGVLFNEIVTTADVYIKVQDINDNRPIFTEASYIGTVSESQKSYTKVTTSHNDALIVMARDRDSGSNSDIVYSFVEENVGIYFNINEKTGEIATNTVLDCEKHPSKFQFHVKAIDRGIPLALSSITPVTITVQNVNDRIPEFVDMQVLTLSQPAYRGMVVHRLKAVDDDVVPQTLKFELDDQSGVFDINSATGEIYVSDPSLLRNQRMLMVHATVSDSDFNSPVVIQIKLIKYKDDPVFRFSSQSLVASVMENRTVNALIVIVNPVGYQIGERLRFRILNPIPQFEIGEVSGIIKVPAGVVFDREKQAFYIIHVEAWRMSSPQIVARTMVNVTIEDMNDNPPVFEYRSFYKAIDIDNNIGATLLSVTATDADIGENAVISYQITGGDGMEFFNCNTDTGVITLKKKFVKSQAKQKYTIEVRASDGADGLEDFVPVEMHLINKDQPMFASNYMQSIPEDATQGQSILKISAHGRHNRQVYYQIVEGDKFEVFHVGYTNGELTVAGEFDYSKQHLYNMKIRAIDSLTGSWSDAICEIVIIDVNNNYPMFEKAAYTVSVLENANIDSSILTISATDKDSGTNAEITYSLTFIDDESFDLFKVGRTTGEISLVSQLDAETRTVHLIQVTASDSGKPEKSSYTYVTINVVDVNDNKPEFLEPQYDFSFEAYHKESQFVGQVQSYDADANDVLTFYIAPKSNYVTVDSTTGTVYLKADPSPNDVVKVTVFASDGKYKSEVEVAVHWKGGNENTPRLSNNYTASVKENGAAEVTFVTKLIATDRDKGKYGEVRYQIDTQDFDEMFKIDDEGNIRTTGVVFDHEKNTKFVIPVRATDGGGLFDLAQIVINVKDENDNSPVFEFSNYEAYVKTSQYSALLIDAFAHDRDGGINSELKYVAHGLGSDTPLLVDNKTGTISLAGNPRGNKYQFSIQVSDNGYPVQQTRADIKVLVKGWNRNILTFTNSTYIHAVGENVSPNLFLLQVKASLKDYNGYITYNIIEGNLPHTQPNGVFGIDPKNGKITLIGKLDYEKIKSYKLMVNAETMHGDNTNCFVVINVLNVNDNSPNFVTKLYSISIAESTLKNTRLVQVAATDKDDPSGTSLAYSFSSRSPYFAIDKRTGWVRTKKPLDREIQDSYDLIIRVKDEGRNIDKTSLSITILDVNDSPPVFTKQHYNFLTKEDTLVRQKIGTVKANDKDLNSTVQYFFNSTVKYNRQFFIDHNNGAISLLKPIKAGLHDFSIVAYDGFHSSHAKVTIRVTDVNDHSPVCANSFYDLQIKEDWDINKSITTIEARDEDTSDSLKYVVQGDGVGKFAIDEKTGVLRAVEKLNYESQSRHNFKIVVTDNAGHNCDSDVFMQLLDVNDNTPKFNQDLYIATVQENTTQSVVVTQVRATDRDTFHNRKLSYTIVTKNINNAFTIGDRGLVTVNNPSVINRKKAPKYTLSIKAQDDGDPQLYSTTRLQIIVLSNTDTPPQFDKLGYTFNLTENNEPDALLGQIIVTSTKNLIDKKIIVTVINDASKDFFVDGNNYLRVKTSLDYEKQARYSFNIRAYYKVIPSLSSTVNVEIQVNDQNDHKPLFPLKGTFRKQIDENVRPGTFVLQAFATDGDGSNKNSLVTYSIQGEQNLPFIIGTQSGVIIVNGTIDHEIKNSYSFDIVAIDNGLPQQKTKVKAIVNITDLNDNPPIISDYNASVIVQEGKTLGSTLLTLTVRDVDSARNGAPFGCVLLEGDSEMFEVTAGENENACVVLSKQIFDKGVKDEYILKLRVTDSGTPTQFSTSQVKVIVVEESFHPPTIQDPKLFFVIVARPYGVTKIGHVNIFDKDANDLHLFKIRDGNAENFFSIQSMSGVIEGRPTEGSYSLTVEVTDGKYTDSGVFKVVVNEFNEQLKVKSISLTLDGVTLKTFMESKAVQFVSSLAKLSGTTSEKVFIWSILDASLMNIRTKRDTEQQKNSLHIAVAVRRADNLEYIEPSVLKGYIENSRNQFASIGFDVSVSSTECTQKKCPEKQNCVVTHTPTEEIVSLYVPSGYMGYKQEEKCYCPDGTEGPVCHDTNPCSHNPCKIGERCVVTSTYFKCECIEANKCDLSVDTVTFTGDSFVAYQLKQPFDTLFTSLSLDFRTETKTDNFLFFATGKDYFYLEIVESGYIKARFDFGSGSGFLMIDRRKVNDGNWHHIQIERYGNFVAMILDKKEGLRQEGRAPGNTAKININGNGIVFGSGLNTDGKPFQGFKGCIRTPKLNKLLLPFSGSDDMVASVDANNVQPDCKDSGRCSVNKCPRFSDCVNTLSSYKCKCLPGHYGENCLSKLTCDDNPCKNGGLCTYEEVNNVVLYKCTCKQGFTGGQCQIALGPCASKPCRNNGKCIIVTESTYTCKCLVGFSGVRCSINENPCASAPCRNGGTCRNLYNDYRCDCPLDRYGKQCAAGDYCTFDPCQNGGVCIEENDGARCKCDDKFFGRHCERDVDECVSSSTCPSSTCINTIGDYYCNCTDGGRRKSCVVAATGGNENAIPLLFVIVGCVGALLLILVIVVVVYCMWKKRKQDYMDYPIRQVDNESRTKYPLDRYPRGAEFDAFLPPSPPPRGEILPPGYYDENEQASAAMYDPSMVTFSSGSSPDPCTKVPLKFSPNTHTSIEYNSEEDDRKSQPGYHWDYLEVPEDIIIKQMSREGSRIQLAKADQYYEDEDELQYVEMPEVPERPASRRSSLPGYADSELPELPELPQQVRLSRQSLRSGNQSPTRGMNSMASSDFRHRYSLLSDETDPDPQSSSYLHDDIEAETMSELTRVTRPRVTRNRFESESSIDDDDGYTETSFNSDDNNRRIKPYDQDNPRELERHIQKLFKDLERRTKEDLDKE